MTWFKVDDGFWSHPKTSSLRDCAVTLWVRAGSYCCQHLTDGFVPVGSLRLLGNPEAADELVEVGLWKPVVGGWVFHDWQEYQETSEVVRKRRDQARERQRRSREQREQSHVTDSVSHTVTDGVTNSVSSQPPTRPDPTNSTPANAGVGAPRKSARRTKIRDGYKPEPHIGEKIHTEFPAIPNETLREVHEDFCLYWQGQGKPMADWDATWLRWMRKELPKHTVGRTNGSNVTAFERKKAANAAVFASLADPTPLEIER